MTETNPGLAAVLEALIEPATRGDPESPLRWTCKSTRRLADELRIKLVVCHFPPGTSKWNKIEHRFFSFITQNWRGRPLVSQQTVVNLIAATTTKTGLVVKAAMDTRTYEIGVKVADEEVAKLRLEPHLFHGKWNYILSPRRKN